MKDDTVTVLSEIAPDLFESPHILPALMQLFAGERQQVLTQQEHLLAHLIICDYCRTAVVVLLAIAQEYDRVNNNPEKVARDLLVHFANINRTIIETHDYERLGTYAEAVVAEGQGKANSRFPDVTAHLRICLDCVIALKETITFIIESEETD